MRPRGDMPYPGGVEPHVRIGLSDIYYKILDVDKRLAKLESHQPLTNGHSRVTNLETIETDHEARIRKLETSVTMSDSLVKERDKNTDDTRANLALLVAGAAFVVGVITDIIRSF